MNTTKYKNEFCSIDHAPQSSPEWHAIRKNLKATASKFGIIYQYIQGKVPKKWLEDPTTPNEAMIMGTICEPHVREWFTSSKWWKPGWKMNEIGIAIPNWNINIGASVDGLITDENGQFVAIIEIKAPSKIYDNLLRPRQNPTPDRNHININHYSQMQGGMAILGVNKCFYIVMGHKREINPNTKTPYPNKIYVEEVPYNELFWSEKLYPAIKKYIE